MQLKNVGLIKAESRMARGRKNEMLGKGYRGSVTPDECGFEV